MCITAEKLLRFHQHHDHRPSTRSLYRSVVNHWNRLELGTLDSVTVSDYRDLRTAEGWSQNTIRYEVGRLRRMASWQGIAIDVKLPPAIQRAPRSWSRKELRQLFRQANRSKRRIYRLPGSIFWPAMLGVTYDTGERISAVYSLTWDAIDLPTRAIHYRAEVRKGRYKDAVGRMSRQTRRSLLRLRGIVVAVRNSYRLRFR